MAEDIEVTPSTLGADSPTPDGGDAAAPESDSTQSWSPEVQAEYTKKTQALADERKAWEAQRDSHNSQLQQQAQQLQNYAASLQQRQQQTQQQQAPQQADPYKSLRELNYLDGGTAAQLFQGVQKAIGQRDLALQQMYKEMSEVRKAVQGDRAKAGNSEFESQLGNTLNGLGIPEELRGDMLEHVRDVALSHEGKGLMKELPDITKKRLDSMRKISRALDKAEADAARKAKSIPGSQGGGASPSGGNKPGYRSPQQLADELWNTFSEGNSE
ncbi:hypothetical protein [uncultured Mediterranean phage]|jgi:hypothetical protein|nr:hypothetical protein [uncultured Mediterranean phage]